MDRNPTTFIAICAAQLHADMSAREHRPDADLALGHLDSLLRSGPVTNPHVRVSAALTLAKLYERNGDVTRALAAVRRRPRIMDSQGVDLLSSLLREEGRLAALAADTVGAVRAYRHYLTLRADPEPGVAAEVNVVRAALAQLQGGGRAGRP